MRRATGMFLLPILVLLACTDTPPTANPMDELTLSSATDNPCPTCAFGPRKFSRQYGVDRIRVTFVPHTAPIDNCTLGVEDDGVPTTSVQVWLNGAIVVERSALLGSPSVLQVPVTLLGSNAIEVAVRGGTGHFIRARIECGPRVTLAPDPVRLSPEATQQFSVSGAPGPYTWAVNGTDGGTSTFGTIDAAGLYLAPAAVPTPASFPVCVRVTSTPTISDCAAVTIVPPPTARMVISSGDGQVAQPGSPVLIPPAVLVTRADGSPWPGVVVTFAVAIGGGSVTGATPTTGADGIATVGSWTLGETPGPNTLTATAAESGIMGNPVTFSAQATAQGFRPSVRTIGTGWDHSCGIRTGGAPYCWGTNENGQIGDGTTALRLVPVPVSGGLRLIGIAVGSSHSCGLNALGDVYCWGNNSAGQLGDGTETNRLVPAATIGGLKFVSLESGGAHTCGITADGTAYCWGFNNWGQLGDGTNIDRLQPTAVAGQLHFTALSAGDSHTCGLTINGMAYCWGSNQFGRLGTGTFLGSSALPIPVVGGLTFSVIESGSRNTCGILSNGGLAYCWGFNSLGQLGNGNRNDQASPAPVVGGLNFTVLAGGDFHTCGIISSGAGYCWGNTLGRDVLAPTDVPGGLTFKGMTSAEFGSCGVTATGALYCWGENYWGQLGDGTINTIRTVPTPVSGGLTFLTGPPE